MSSFSSFLSFLLLNEVDNFQVYYESGEEIKHRYCHSCYCSATIVLSFFSE
uniref:Uncharacterized protein n=1 Tax=Arundo donax TaxID=35708 RepID=A0A0A8ZAE5_ARUDO